MCVDGGIGIRKLEKLSHTRVPEKDFLSAIGKTIGEAYQAVTSTAGITSLSFREMFKRRKRFWLLLWEWWRWVEMKVGFWIRDFQVFETEVQVIMDLIGTQRTQQNEPSNTEPSKTNPATPNPGADEPRRRRACSSPPLIRSERVRLVGVQVRRGLVCWVRRSESAPEFVGKKPRRLRSFVGDGDWVFYRTKNEALCLPLKSSSISGFFCPILLSLGSQWRRWVLGKLISVK
nr:hypothetical protein CFP56_33326 [Quercus suber]